MGRIAGAEAQARPDVLDFSGIESIGTGIPFVAREPQRNTNYELIEAMAQIAREKSVDKATVIDTLVAGLLSAGRL